MTAPHKPSPLEVMDALEAMELEAVIHELRTLGPEAIRGQLAASGVDMARLQRDGEMLQQMAERARPPKLTPQEMMDAFDAQEIEADMHELRAATREESDAELAAAGVDLRRLREDARVIQTIADAGGAPAERIREELRAAPARDEPPASQRDSFATARPDAPEAAEAVPQAPASERERERAPIRLHPRRRMTTLVLLAAAATLVALGAAAAFWPRRPPAPRIEQPPPPPPAPSETAPPLDVAQLREDAFGDCEREEWKACLDALDHAGQMDPAGDTAPSVKKARDRAKREIAALVDGGGKKVVP